MNEELQNLIEFTKNLLTEFIYTLEGSGVEYFYGKLDLGINVGIKIKFIYETNTSLIICHCAIKLDNYNCRKLVWIPELKDWDVHNCNVIGYSEF